MAVAEDDFNRFFSYTDEVKSQSILPYKYAVREPAWLDLQVDVIKRLNVRTVNPRNVS